MLPLDESFCSFNGYLQVNATDLKLTRYPSREALKELGQWVKQDRGIIQEMIVERLGGLTDLLIAITNKSKALCKASFRWDYRAPILRHSRGYVQP